MNFLDLMSFIGEGNSLSIENCKVQLTVQQNEGGLELNIDFFTADQKNYDQTQKFLADRGVDWLEHFYKPVGATISHIEVKTKLNLFLFHGMEEQLQNHIWFNHSRLSFEEWVKLRKGVLAVKSLWMEQLNRQNNVSLLIEPVP